MSCLFNPIGKGNKIVLEAVRLLLKSLSVIFLIGALCTKNFVVYSGEISINVQTNNVTYNGIPAKYVSAQVGPFRWSIAVSIPNGVSVTTPQNITFSNGFDYVTEHQPLDVHCTSTFDQIGEQTLVGSCASFQAFRSLFAIAVSGNLLQVLIGFGTFNIHEDKVPKIVKILGAIAGLFSLCQLVAMIIFSKQVTSDFYGSIIGPGYKVLSVAVAFTVAAAIVAVVVKWHKMKLAKAKAKWSATPQKTEI